jgi:glycosyltransferase involved in cell wall biosynthesis
MNNRGSDHHPLRVVTLITRLEGGAGGLALRGAKALDPAEFETTIIAGSGNHLLDEAAAVGLEVIVEPTLRTPLDPRSDVRALRALSALLSQRSFDVAHTHTSKAGALGRIAAHRAAVPRIVHTYHGFPFHEFQSRIRRDAYIAVERRLGRITDVALCVGTGVAVEAVRRRLIAPERIRTIGVAVDGASGPELPARAAGARERARRVLGIPAEATAVGAVGRLTYQKAPEDFLTMIGLVGRTDVVGVWVGGGELAERIGHLARKQPAGRIVLAGERADIPEILSALDVFALPSRYEGLPTAVVEAMVCGVPVVATAVNAVADVVVPGETGLLVPPQRPDLMADAVRYLIDRPAVAARMAVTARASLGERYGTSALRSALTEAYAGSSTDNRSTAVTRALVAGNGFKPLPAGRSGLKVKISGRASAFTPDTPERDLPDG